MEKKESFSYSKLTTFETCKESYFRNYFLKDPGETNMLAEYGTFMHKLLELMLSGKITVAEAIKQYEKEFYTYITEPIYFTFGSGFSKDFTSSYYDKGMYYLEHFDNFKDYKIIAVEKKFFVEMDDYCINGIIDVVAQDKDGNYVVIDHKSANPFKPDVLEEKKRQLYMYCAAIKQEYGEYPKQLIYNHFKANFIQYIDFNKEDLDSTLAWIDETVKEIRNCKTFTAKENACGDFFCTTLCNYRNNCKYNRE